MTNRDKDIAHLTSLIADLDGRAAKAAGIEKSRLESAAEYYRRVLALGR